MESDRLILRKFEEKDVNDLFKIASDDRVTKYLTWETHKTIEESLTTIKTIYNTNKVYAIVKKDNGQVIGCFDVREDRANNKISFGYMLGYEHWGNGYMVEVLNYFIKLWFMEKNFNKVYPDYYIDNKNSGRVMEKCGMIVEGISKEHVFIKGIYHDVIHMAILKKDYLKRGTK